MELKNAQESVYILYHGSSDIVKAPIFGYGKTANDPC